MEWVIGGILLLLFLYAGKRVNDKKARAVAEQKEQRRNSLLKKYEDNAIVDDILDGLIWQGMTSEMVIDSWGEPAAIDERIYRTKIARTYKYGPGSRHSFQSRVMLEDGFVIGWRQKNGTQSSDVRRSAKPPEPSIDHLRSLVSNLELTVKDITHQGGTSYFVNFEMHCTKCGGYLLNIPDDQSEEENASCTACGHVFGRYGDVKALASEIGQQELKKRGLSK